MSPGSSTVAVVRDVLVETLGIQERADAIDADTALLGGIPELDSLGVLEVVTALEERFGIEVDDEDFTGEVFESVGSLAQLIDEKRAAVGG